MSSRAILTIALVTAASSYAVSPLSEAGRAKDTITGRQMNCELAKIAATPVNFDELPRGEYEYVQSEYRLEGPDSSRMRVDEDVYQTDGGLRIRSTLGCIQGLAKNAVEFAETKRYVPRVFILSAYDSDIGLRQMTAGHDGPHAFFNYENLKPSMGVPNNQFMSELQRAWQTVRFEKLSTPFHYALYLQRLTPSGISETRMIYRNTQALSHGLEVDAQIAGVAMTDVI